MALSPGLGPGWCGAFAYQGMGHGEVSVCSSVVVMMEGIIFYLIRCGLNNLSRISPNPGGNMKRQKRPNQLNLADSLWLAAWVFADLERWPRTSDLLLQELAVRNLSGSLSLPISHRLEFMPLKCLRV